MFIGGDITPINTSSNSVPDDFRVCARGYDNLSIYMDDTMTICHCISHIFLPPPSRMLLRPTIRQLLQHPFLLFRKRPSLLFFHLVLPPREQPSVLYLVLIRQMMVLVYVSFECLIVRHPLIFVLCHILLIPL